MGSGAGDKGKSFDKTYRLIRSKRLYMFTVGDDGWKVKVKEY